MNINDIRRRDPRDRPSDVGRSDQVFEQGSVRQVHQKFSYDLLLGLNEVELGKQFAHSELSRGLVEERDFLGLIRRGEHVTVLYRVRSTRRKGSGSGAWCSATRRGKSASSPHRSF
jgi:hypothetical protein